MQTGAAVSAPATAETGFVNPASIDTQIAPSREPPPLPVSAQAVTIIKSIKDTAKANALAWPQAEYKVNPISNDSLSTLEIRTTLKGPYPKVQQVLKTVLDKEPALALRELQLSRPDGDASEVEAKILWVVFLADGWSLASDGGQHE